MSFKKIKACTSAIDQYDIFFAKIIKVIGNITALTAQAKQPPRINCNASNSFKVSESLLTAFVSRL